METTGIVLVTGGDPSRRTGGNLYNERIADALRRGGSLLDVIVLGDSSAHASLKDELRRRHPAVVIVDSIALTAVAPHLGWLIETLRTRIVALMHMLPSDLTFLSAKLEGLAASNQSRQLARLQSAESRLFEVADCIVAVSPPFAQRLIDAGAPPERVAVIPPGWDGSDEHTATREKAAVRGRDVVRFLCVASWTAMKGIHLVVDAFSALAGSPLDAELHLIGEAGNDRYAQGVSDRIAASPRSASIVVHGSVAPSTLAAWYRFADVFVLPSMSESFGTVYAEAMSFGLPVIASDVSSSAWLVESDCGMLVGAGDVIGIVDAMRWLSVDPELRRRMGAAARARVGRLPTWARTEADFSEAIRQLTG